MKCNYVKDAVVLYSEGCLSPETESDVKEHLSSCKDCKNYYKEYKKLSKSEKAVSPVEYEEADGFAKIAKRLKVRTFLDRSLCIVITGIAVSAFFIAYKLIAPTDKFKEFKSKFFSR
ncbi:MAG: anti-sigma factor family protein [Oscillospiraceae bacterium]